MLRFVSLLLPLALALHVPLRKEILRRSAVRADASQCFGLGGPAPPSQPFGHHVNIAEPNSSWTHVAKEPRPPPKQLLFIHMEKMAGGFIETVTGHALPAGSLQTYHHCGVPPAKPPDDYFIMSSMRNPCEQKVSAWSYCCEKTFLSHHGQHNTAAVMEREFQRGDCPKFRAVENSGGNRHTQPLKGETVDKNVKGFRNWLNSSAVSAVPAFNVYFETSFTKDRVNCWVMYEDIGRTLRHCLEKFENFTGRAVNWTRFEEKIRTQEHQHNSTHGGCSEYYTPALREQQRQREMPIMSYFGYTDCCGD